MSYNFGIRTAPKQFPVVRWTQFQCVVCHSMIWIPGKPTGDPVACADHEASIGNVAAYLESITDRG